MTPLFDAENQTMDAAPSAVSAGDEAPSPRRSIVLAPILLISLLFYAWTGTSEKINPFATGSLAKLPDAYNQLTSAFLKGHLSLLGKTPPEFLALKDPYDPAQNGPWSGLYHDLAYYKGHFFLSWGPTPVVTLLMPWRLFQHGNLPVNVGVIIYCWLGLVFSVALLCFLVDRYLPDTKRWQIGIAAVALALCNVAPFLLRRPDTYELAISSAFCFSMLGAYLLASGGLRTPRSRWRLAAGSLSVGLAIGGRPDLIFEALILVPLLLYLVRRDGVTGRKDISRCAGVILGPCAFVLVLLALYNAARFGSPLENGAGYALGGIEMTKVPMYQVRTLVPNLYYYVIAPARWTYAFPYVTLPPPPAYPWKLASFYYGEMTGGLLTTTPIVLGSVPALLVLARRGLRELRTILFLFLGVGVLTLLFLTVVLPGTTMRYEVDFASFFLIPALIGWFVLTSGRGRRAIAVLGVPIILYGCVVGAAISFSGYYDGLRYTHPNTYWTINRLTSPLPTAVTMILGHPVIARVFSDGQVSVANAQNYGLAKTTFLFGTAPVEIDVISPRNGRWMFAPTIVRTPESGRGAVWIEIRLDDGHRQSVAIGLGPTGLPVTLHRGLNRIQLNTRTAKGRPQAILAVNGLRIVKP